MSQLIDLTQRLQPDFPDNAGSKACILVDDSDVVDWGRKSTNELKIQDDITEHKG